MAEKVKSLILTESAGAARAIKKFAGSSYGVVSTEGFLKDLPRSRIGIDAEKGYAPDYITVRGKGPLLNELRKKTANAGRIFLATNPDAAGEFLALQCCELFGVNEKSNCRVIFDEFTKPPLKAALEKARPIDMKLVDAFQTRQLIDKFMSHRVGEYLECKIFRGVKVGRFRAMLLKLISTLKPVETFELSGALTFGRLQELALAKLNFSMPKTRLLTDQLYEGFDECGGLIKYPHGGAIRLTENVREPAGVKDFLTENQFKLYELIYVAAGGVSEKVSSDGKISDLTVTAALDELGVDWAEFYSIGINSLLKRKYIAAGATGYAVTDLGKMVLSALEGYFDEIFSVKTYKEISAHIGAVADGKAEKNSVVAKYCGAFSKNFSAAMESLGENANPKDELSDEVCDKCGRPMIVKHGRYGTFLACSGYPECKNIRPHVDYLAQNCPKCGGRITRQTFRGGRNLYGCDSCDFRTWDDPLENPCKECGSTMFAHKFRGRAPMVYCGNENCKSRENHPINKILADAQRRYEAKKNLKDSGREN